MQWISAKYFRFYRILTPSKMRVFGAIFIALALLLVWRELLVAGIVIGSVQLVGMVFLPILRTEYAVMSLVTYPIGKIVGFVAMGLIYFLVITPIGLIKKRTFDHGWVESTKEISPDKMHE